MPFRDFIPEGEQARYPGVGGGFKDFVPDPREAGTSQAEVEAAGDEGVHEAAPVLDTETVACEFCATLCKPGVGLIAHVRIKHKDDYQKWKAEYDRR